MFLALSDLSTHLHKAQPVSVLMPHKRDELCGHKLRSKRYMFIFFCIADGDDDDGFGTTYRCVVRNSARVVDHAAMLLLVQ